MNGIIIQARATSTRFPNKIFSKIMGQPAICNVVDQCLKSNIDRVVLAIPKHQRHLFFPHVSEYFKNKKFKLHCGSEDNVIKRFFDASTSLSLKTIIRITSDCFAINPRMIDSCLKFYENSDYDYVNNSTVNRVLSEANPDDYQTDTGTPDGFNVEIFSASSLREAYENAESRYDVEHVTPWIKRNKKCCVFDTGKIYLDGKFSVDEPEDIEVIRAFFTLLNNNRIRFEI